MTFSEMRTHTVTGALCVAVLFAITALPPAQSSEENQTDPGTATTEPVDTRLIARGKRLYVFCQACHSTEASPSNKIGPHLEGILDRPVAAVEGSTYSAALQEQDFVWSEDKLNLWLQQPSAMVPETIMSFAGIQKAELRSALIAYLKTL